MSSKVDLLKKRIAELQAQLGVEMAKNANVSDCTLPAYLDTYRKDKTIVGRTVPKVIKRPKVIGNIEEIKETRLLKDLKSLGTLTNLKLIGSLRYLKWLR